MSYGIKVYCLPPAPVVAVFGLLVPPLLYQRVSYLFEGFPCSLNDFPVCSRSNTITFELF